MACAVRRTAQLLLAEGTLPMYYQVCVLCWLGSVMRRDGQAGRRRAGGRAHRRLAGWLCWCLHSRPHVRLRPGGPTAGPQVQHPRGHLAARAVPAGGAAGLCGAHGRHGHQAAPWLCGCVRCGAAAAGTLCAGLGACCSCLVLAAVTWGDRRAPCPVVGLVHTPYISQWQYPSANLRDMAQVLDRWLWRHGCTWPWL